jgi:O-antigen/teichoic acid export membrane protein
MSGFFGRNAIFAAIEILGRVPMLFVIGYLASSVGPGVYGDWALVLAAAGVLSGLAGLGLNSSIPRTASGVPADLAKGYLSYALRLTAGVVAGAGALLAAAHQPIGAALGIAAGSRWLLALGGLLVLSATVEGLFDAYFKARERFGLQTGLVLGRTVIELVVVAVVFGTDVFGVGPQGRLALYVCLTVGAKLLILYPGLWLAPPRSADQPDPPGRRAFVRFGRPMVPAALVLWLTTQGDRLVLGHAVTAEQLGWYAFGGALALNLTYLRLAIFPLLLPRASVLHDSGDHDEVVRLFDLSQRVFLHLFAGIAVAIALLAPDIVAIAAGDAFAPAAPILILLSLAVGLEGLFGIFEWVFLLVRRTSLVLVFNLFNMALQVVAVFAVATLTGDIVAVAWTALGVVVVANGIRYLVARRLYPVRAARGVLVVVVAVALVVVVAEELSPSLPVAVRVAAAAVACAAGAAVAMQTVRARGILRRATVAAGVPSRVGGR